jgi:hypothetical protein
VWQKHCQNYAELKKEKSLEKENMSVASMVFGNKLTVKQEGKLEYLPG